MTTRRSFLRTAALAPLAATAPALAFGSRHAFARELRVGVVGCGGRGTGAALQALFADPHAVIWAVGDAFAERIEASVSRIAAAAADRDEDEEDGLRRADRVQVPAERRFVGLDCHRDVLASGVDVILLCTPPAFRPQQYVDAVAAGCHVFAEKPVAVDAPGVRAVLEASKEAKRQNLSIMSGFCWRYSAREREIFRRIHEGAIGDLVTVYTTYNATGWIAPRPRQAQWSDMEFQLRNWHYFNWLSGDHLVEQAVHATDKIHWAFRGKAPDRVTAVGGRQTRPDRPETGDVWDHFALTYEYGDARAFHMCRHWPNTPSDNSDLLLGTEGKAVVNGWTDTHVITGANPWSCTTPRNDMYQQEHDELFASIRADAGHNDGELMATSTLLSIMGRMAAYTGQVVTWEQAMNSEESLVPSSLEWGDLPTPQVPVPGTRPLV